MVDDAPALSYAAFVRRRVERRDESLDGSARAHARTFFDTGELLLAEGW